MRCRSDISIATRRSSDFVAELDVGVARDPERMLREHVHAGEQRVEVRGDDLLQRHVARAVGHGHEPGEQRRHLHPGEALFAAGAVAHRHCEVERQVRDVRERVRGVDRERREHREDAIVEHAGELVLGLGLEIGPGGERHPGLLQRGR